MFLVTKVTLLDDLVLEHDDQTDAISTWVRDYIILHRLWVNELGSQLQSTSFIEHLFEASMVLVPQEEGRPVRRLLA